MLKGELTLDWGEATLPGLSTSTSTTASRRFNASPNHHHGGLNLSLACAPPNGSLTGGLQTVTTSITGGAGLGGPDSTGALPATTSNPIAPHAPGAVTAASCVGQAHTHSQQPPAPAQNQTQQQSLVQLLMSDLKPLRRLGQRCTSYDPNQRPKFTTIVQALEKIEHQLQQAQRTSGPHSGRLAHSHAQHHHNSQAQLRNTSGQHGAGGGRSRPLLSCTGATTNSASLLRNATSGQVLGGAIK